MATTTPIEFIDNFNDRIKKNATTIPQLESGLIQQWKRKTTWEVSKESWHRLEPRMVRELSSTGLQASMEIYPWAKTIKNLWGGSSRPFHRLRASANSLSVPGMWLMSTSTWEMAISKENFSKNNAIGICVEKNNWGQIPHLYCRITWGLLWGYVILEQIW